MSNTEELSRYVGYCRISTRKQSIDVQMSFLKPLCIKIFEDTISGTNFDRKGLNDLLKYLRKGDIVLCYSIDRLGRLARPLMKLFEDITKRGAYLKTLSGTIIDPLNPSSVFMFQMQCVMAEYECKIIIQRMKDGIERSHKNGIYGGRPHKYTRADVILAKQMHKEGYTVRKILEEFNISRGTFYTMLKADGASFKPRKKYKK